MKTERLMKRVAAIILATVLVISSAGYAIPVHAETKSAESTEISAEETGLSQETESIFEEEQPQESQRGGETELASGESVTEGSEITVPETKESETEETEILEIETEEVSTEETEAIETEVQETETSETETEVQETETSETETEETETLETETETEETGTLETETGTEETETLETETEEETLLEEAEEENISLFAVSNGSKIAQVSTHAEFEQALYEMMKEAEALVDGQTMSPHIIELMNDIEMEDTDKLDYPYGYIFMGKGSNLEIRSKAGSHYRISPADPKTSREVIIGGNNSRIKLKDVTIDCKGSAEYQRLAITMFNGTLILENAVITGGYSDTPIINMMSGKAEIKGSTITGNTKIDWVSTLVPGFWGVVTLLVAELEMENSTVTDNVSDRGGALHIINKSKAVLDNCTVSNNISKNERGGGLSALANSEVTINGGKFVNNKAFGGGGLHFVNSVLTANNVEITDNESSYDKGEGEGGGGISITNNSTATITGGKISNNYSDISGGGMQIFYNSNVELKGVELSGNVAETHGGAICVADGFSSDESTKSVVTLTGATLSNNTANSVYTDEEHKSDPLAPGGGAVYAHENCQIYVKDGTTFQGNRTLNNGHGGAAYICFGGVMEVLKGVFEKNEASGNGGAVYLDGSGSYEGCEHYYNFDTDNGYGAGSLMRFEGGLITENKAVNGGAIYIAGSNMVKEEEYRGGRCLMADGVITDNQALNQGGGIYVEAAQSGEMAGSFDMSGGALYYNVAGENGNTSTGAEDAGAELFSEGGNSLFTVVSAEEMTGYIQNKKNTYIPKEDRAVWFTNWYYDYSDQDGIYGKADSKTETKTYTGRYMSSKTLDRMVYTPETEDKEYSALILDKNTSLELKKSMGGSNIIEDEIYEFEITVTNLPDIAVAGSKYPVTFTGSPQSDKIGTLADGSSYIVFDGSGKTIVSMKADDALTISGLPAGAAFEIKETDAKSSTYIKASGENCQNFKVNKSDRLITGKTNEKWKGSTAYTAAKVNVTNCYGKEPVNVINPENQTPTSGIETKSESETVKSTVSVIQTNKTEERKVVTSLTSPKTGEVYPVLEWLSGMFKAAGF